MVLQYTPKIDAHSGFFQIVQMLLGYQLHPDTVLYESWTSALEAAEAMAEEKRNEYIRILNKVDEMSFHDCHHFKSTTLYILVDIRKPHEPCETICVSPVYAPKIEKVD